MSVFSIVGLGFLGSPVTDVAFISVAVVVAAWAIKVGYRRHGSLLPAILFVAGMSLILVSHFALGHHTESGTWSAAIGRALSALGGIVLVTFHFVNSRMANRAGCSH